MGAVSAHTTYSTRFTHGARVYKIAFIVDSLFDLFPLLCAMVRRTRNKMSLSFLLDDDNNCTGSRPYLMETDIVTTNQITGTQNDVKEFIGIC